MEFILDFILHIDQYMISIVQDYHTWAYAILFIIIFCETGLVVTPFLPGDSLLFVAGAISALPGMPIDIHILVLILFAAAVLFVAGMGKMHYYYFMIYNLIGGAIWVVLFCYAGYFFGDLPFVQENLKLLIIAIIFISILPAIIEILRAKLGSKQ